MASYVSTLASGTRTLAAATATIVPASALSGRKLLKIFNDLDTTTYYGASGVTVSTGIPIPPGGESDWIPTDGGTYAINTAGGDIRYLEGA